MLQAPSLPATKPREAGIPLFTFHKPNCVGLLKMHDRAVFSSGGQVFAGKPIHTGHQDGGQFVQNQVTLYCLASPIIRDEIGQSVSGNQSKKDLLREV